MADKNLRIKVSTKGAKKARRSLGGVEGGLKSLGKSALIAGAAFFGARAIISGLKAATNAAAEQQLAEKKLEAVLKSTSHAAGLQAKELKKLASSLQSTTMFGDEAIIGAESLMLTFTKIGADVFPDAIETVLNMSTAMGTDLQSSVIQLGKALNDPVVGISALSRVGVQLTEDQKKQIKSFAAVGDVASAQKVILGELETQFGGLAEAAGQTMAGSMAQAKNAIGDAAEALGDLLAPMVKGGAVMVKQFSKSVETAFDFIGTIDFKETGKNLLKNGSALMKAFTDTVKAYFEFLPVYWKGAINLIFPMMKKVLNSVIALVEKFAGFIWEPIPISAHIMVLRIKKFFLELNVDMTNKMRDAVNNIKEEFNKLVENFPKISEKLGLVKSELAEPIDMSEATSSIVSQIAGLQKDLEGTGMAQLFRKMFMGEGDIESAADFAERLNEIWSEYADNVLVLNKKIVESEEQKENAIIKGGSSNLEVQSKNITALEEWLEKNKEQVTVSELIKAAEQDIVSLTTAYNDFSANTNLTGEALIAKDKEYEDAINSRKETVVAAEGIIRAEKQKSLILEMKQAALVQGTAIDAMKAVVRAETMEMIAGAISSVFKTVPYPFNFLIAAGVGASAATLLDSALASFAQGGDFITSGPQMIMVGDNPSGRERVQVTPSEQGISGGITVNISAPLVDETVIESIIPAIERAQRLNLA